MKKTPNYIKYILLHVILLFSYIFLFRVIFYAFFAELENATSTEIRKAFLLGAQFDFKLAAIVFFPIAFLVLITNYNFFKKCYRKNLKSIV